MFVVTDIVGSNLSGWSKSLITAREIGRAYLLDDVRLAGATRHVRRDPTPKRSRSPFRRLIQAYSGAWPECAFFIALGVGSLTASYSAQPRLGNLKRPTIQRKAFWNWILYCKLTRTLWAVTSKSPKVTSPFWFAGQIVAVSVWQITCSISLIIETVTWSLIPRGKSGPSLQISCTL